MCVLCLKLSISIKKLMTIVIICNTQGVSGQHQRSQPINFKILVLYQIPFKIINVYCYFKNVKFGFQCNSQISKEYRLLKFCYVPATSATSSKAFLASFLFFLLRPLTVLMKQTRQVLCTIKQSILLRCLWCNSTRHKLLC